MRPAPRVSKNANAAAISSSSTRNTGADAVNVCLPACVTRHTQLLTGDAGAAALNDHRTIQN
jgi:hypothetical protein